MSTTDFGYQIGVGVFYQHGTKDYRQGVVLEGNDEEQLIEVTIKLIRKLKDFLKVLIVIE